MCGACGSTVYSDPVMGDEHTLRRRILVARTVTAVCAGTPGAPRTTALGAGWSVAGATGSIALCRTVAEVWLAVLRMTSGPHLREALEAGAIVETADPLSARVVALGLRLTR